MMLGTELLAGGGGGGGAAKRSLVLGTWFALVVSFIVATGGPAWAQDSDGDDSSGAVDFLESTLVVSSVDATTETPTVALFGVSPSTPVDQISATSRSGDVVVVSAETSVAAGWPVDAVLVVDVDNRTVSSGFDETAANAVSELLKQLPSGSTLGLISAGREADIASQLTSSRSRVEIAAMDMPAERGSALIDGVDLAAGMLFDTAGANPNQQTVRSIIVLADGGDTSSTKTADEVAAAVLQAGAQVVVLGTTSAPQLEGLVEATAGSLLIAESAGEIDAATAVAAELAANRLLVTINPETDSTDRFNVALAVADQITSFSYPAALATDSTLQLQPLAESGSEALAFLGKPIFLYLSVLLAFAGIAMAIWALGSMFIRGDSTLDRILARYNDGEELADDEVQEMLVETALLQRAVQMTENFAEERGFLARVEQRLERAAVPIRPGEALFFLAGFVVLVVALVAIVGGSIVPGIVFGVVAAGAGFAALNLMVRRRLKKFEAQLPDTLQMLAGTLRAGYSLPQGLDAVSKEIEDPMGGELRRAMTEAQLGRELEDSLGAVAERLDSADFAWAVMALGIQREVGGNLNELLMTVAETMVQRERLKREVAALTAEGRVSAMILSLMPPGLGLVLYIMNPDYVGILFTRTVGLVLVGLAVVSALIGLLWMRKVITIDA